MPDADMRRLSAQKWLVSCSGLVFVCVTQLKRLFVGIRMANRYMVLLIAGLLAACSNEADWKDTPVSKAEMSFVYEGDDLPEDGEFTRTRNSRTGTVSERAILIGDDAWAFLEYYKAGQDRYYDTTIIDQFVPEMNEDFVTFDLKERVNIQRGESAVAVEIAEVSDGQGCMRFAMPLKRSRSADNPAVVAYETVISGFHCREGGVVDEAEIAQFLGKIKLNP